jgi:hypothetical protein
MRIIREFFSNGVRWWGFRLWGILAAVLRLFTDRTRFVAGGIKNLGFIETAHTSALANLSFLPPYMTISEFNESLADSCFFPPHPSNEGVEVFWGDNYP